MRSPINPAPINAWLCVARHRADCSHLTIPYSDAATPTPSQSVMMTRRRQLRRGNRGALETNGTQFAAPPARRLVAGLLNVLLFYRILGIIWALL